MRQGDQAANVPDAVDAPAQGKVGPRALARSLSRRALASGLRLFFVWFLLVVISWEGHLVLESGVLEDPLSRAVRATGARPIGMELSVWEVKEGHLATLAELKQTALGCLRRLGVAPQQLSMESQVDERLRAIRYKGKWQGGQLLVSCHSLVPPDPAGEYLPAETSIILRYSRPGDVEGPLRLRWRLQEALPHESSTIGNRALLEGALLRRLAPDDAVLLAERVLTVLRAKEAVVEKESGEVRVYGLSPLLMGSSWHGPARVNLVVILHIGQDHTSLVLVSPPILKTP